MEALPNRMIVLLLTLSGSGGVRRPTSRGEVRISSTSEGLYRLLQQISSTSFILCAWRHAWKLSDDDTFLSESEKALSGSPEPFGMRTSFYIFQTSRVEADFTFFASTSVHHESIPFAGTTTFSRSVDLDCTRDPDFMETDGAATSLEVRATGVSYVLALNVAVNSRYDLQTGYMV
ncbi:hypothetical protein R1sor_025383 [Riccia sorocarpa]|uniref:Uncharacterized protein n=1 Tax=Riccia sorocarpa TaxID=122646 RepID=A0ABD3G8H2_9MARC